MTALDPERIRTALAEQGRRDRQSHAERLERASLREGTVCSIDPSLAATGLAVLRHTEHELAVVDWETIRWKKGLDGPAWRDAAGDELWRVLVRNLESIRFHHPDVEAVVEAPPVGHVKGKGSTDSTLLAGRVARDAALHVGVPLREPVTISAHKELITGSKKAEKPEVGMCLGLLAQSLPIVGFPAKTNDNVRDAVCIGIYDLHRRVS